jgi:2-polyprenyl-3-methyl-5-hydroxy-6-metoxy-1,4-benzoquinol methylase
MGYTYKYLDEINEAVLRQFPSSPEASKIMVLDIGCGTGSLSEAIRNKGYTVWGIDVSTEASQIASTRVDKIINQDLTNLAAISPILEEQQFDYLVFSDILEHLIDPSSILEQYLRFLKKDGSVIISLPNTVAWIERIKFLFGNFTYTETGILDSDHLRFFTLKSAKKMLLSAKCSIIKTDYIPYFIRAFQPIIKKILLKNRSVDENREILMDSPYYKFYTRFLYPIEYWIGYPFKSFFAFKIIIAGKKL